jgi:hypothetical protein
LHHEWRECDLFRSPDGAVYATLGPAWRGFNELLADAITPLPPIGSEESSLSTYWIDRAIREVQRRQERDEDGIVQGGNATTLLLHGSNVIAASDYDLFDDVHMPIKDFLTVLIAWRSEVLEVRDAEHPQIPQTYRRNPYP